MVTLTDAAVSKVESLLQEKKLKGYGLRVFISGGGCSGMQYGMALTADTTENDHVVEINGVQVIIDAMSMQYLQGAKIDYVDTLMGGGFQIDNPNAKSSCGCGNSFGC